MKTFSALLSELGTRNVAKATGVTDAAVSKWKSAGRLPVRQGVITSRTEAYENLIARLAEISVQSLREMIAYEQSIKSAA